MEPATVPLVGDRWTPFVHTLEYQGEDLAGATFKMDVRLTYDAPGAPIISLGTVFGPSEGVYLIFSGAATVAAHIAAGRMSEVPGGMDASEIIDLSIIGIRINEPNMEAMPFPGERGEDAILYYDLHATPTGGVKQVWFRGTFTVRAGATQ